MENGADKKKEIMFFWWRFWMLGYKDIEFKDGVDDYLNNCEDLVTCSKEVILFGSARGGEKVYSFLEERQLQNKVVLVADNDEMKQGKEFHGLPIVSANEMIVYLKSHKDTIIAVASGSAHIIIDQLEGLGVEKKAMYPFAFSMLQLSPTPFMYFNERKELIKKVYELLADEKSRDVFISLLNFKMTMDDNWLLDIADNEHDQYFDDLMRLKDNEVFVDCGAYIGDTLDEYNIRMNGKWKEYCLFEADPSVFMEMKNHINDCRYSRCSCYNVGCWDKKERLYFQCTGSGSSQISEKKYDQVINADALDNVLKGKDVTVIKMDVEGAEQKALKGAEGIIRSQHPKLAISNYHSLDDFLHIPIILQNFHKDYNIYLRHYRKLTDSETICYAV